MYTFCKYENVSGFHAVSFTIVCLNWSNSSFVCTVRICFSISRTAEGILISCFSMLISENIIKYVQRSFQVVFSFFCCVSVVNLRSYLCSWYLFTGNITNKTSNIVISRLEIKAKKQDTIFNLPSIRIRHSVICEINFFHQSILHTFNPLKEKYILFIP